MGFSWKKKMKRRTKSSKDEKDHAKTDREILMTYLVKPRASLMYSKTWFIQYQQFARVDSEIKNALLTRGNRKVKVESAVKLVL